MKQDENPQGEQKRSVATEKRFYRRGQHPNSLRNLRPAKKGERLNPHGRAGKQAFDSQIRDIFFNTPEWRALVRETEKTERLLNRALKEQFGFTADEMWEREKRMQSMTEPKQQTSRSTNDDVLKEELSPQAAIERKPGRRRRRRIPPKGAKKGRWNGLPRPVD